jgi:hypothetical protein
MNYIPLRHMFSKAIGRQKQTKICIEGRRRVLEEDSRDMRECHL